MYQVKEIFKTIQGEGFHAGRAAVFCRFSGCNLWSGREEDRSSTCKFCDTDFRAGVKYEDAGKLSDAILLAWDESRPQRFVVFTGEEPLLQLDAALIDAVHAHGFAVAVETNGTISAPAKIQWLCVSPKAGASIVQREADELKLVYPQDGMSPEYAASLIACSRKSIQPMDGPNLDSNTSAAVEFCIANPHWRLSLQTHKFIGIR